MNHHLLAFCKTTEDLLHTEEVRSMGQWNHHGSISCLDHSLFVAYLSFRIARFLKLDAAAAARAGLLHDLYLYDSKDKSAHPGNQCFDHPRAADLTDKEHNIILSHMWPLGGALPRSSEAFLVDFIDTLCAGVEFSRVYCPSRLRRTLNVKPLHAN